MNALPCSFPLIFYDSVAGGHLWSSPGQSAGISAGSRPICRICLGGRGGREEWARECVQSVCVCANNNTTAGKENNLDADFKEVVQALADGLGLFPGRPPDIDAVAPDQHGAGLWVALQRHRHVGLQVTLLLGGWKGGGYKQAEGDCPWPMRRQSSHWSQVNAPIAQIAHGLCCG